MNQEFADNVRRNFDRVRKVNHLVDARMREQARRDGPTRIPIKFVPENLNLRVKDASDDLRSAASRLSGGPRSVKDALAFFRQVVVNELPAGVADEYRSKMKPPELELIDEAISRAEYAKRTALGFLEGIEAHLAEIRQELEAVTIPVVPADSLVDRAKRAVGIGR